MISPTCDPTTRNKPFRASAGTDADTVTNDAVAYVGLG